MGFCGEFDTRWWMLLGGMLLVYLPLPLPPATWSVLDEFDTSFTNTLRQLDEFDRVRGLPTSYHPPQKPIALVSDPISVGRFYWSLFKIIYASYVGSGLKHSVTLILTQHPIIRPTNIRV